MAYNNSDEIFISMHADDKEAFYAKIPYDKLPNIHRIGGKWMQSGKEWRFPLDDQIWEKFQKEFASEFATGKVHKDAAFLLAFDKRHKDLDRFLKFKEVAMRDEPTEFGVDGVSLNGKNCLFNYQRWGVQCGLTVGDGFLIGDSMGLGKCLASSNLCNFNVGIRRVSDVVDNLDEDGWYKSDDGMGEWHEIDDLKILGNDRGKEAYFPVSRAYRERVPSVAEVKLQNGLENVFGWNHKFFTNHGWKAVHELSESDWVLVNEKIVPNATVHYNDDDIFWLAWQIGEGSDCSSHTHSISNTDLPLLQKLKSCIEAHRQEVVLNGNGKASYVVSIHEDCRHIEGHKDKYSLNFNYRYTECLHRIFGYKMHTKSGDKEIPMSILNSDDENARLFIRCMWDAEGCCNKSNLELSSKSYDVIEKMWYLLKRFGIFGIVSSKMARVKSGMNKYWKLLVGGVYARRFKDEIGFATPYKQEALERLCRLVENTNIGMSSPCKELLNHLVADVLETSYNIVGIDSGKLHGHHEYGAGKVRELVDNIGRLVNEGVYRKKSKWSHLEDNFNRNRIERRLEIEEILSVLRAYYIGGHQWLKVVSVKPVDCNDGFYVYDFEVDDCNHNYYASGMLTHNTIQGLGIAKERMNRGEARNCLIVCPASLKYNWRDEISKFMNMDALVIGHKCKNAQDREKQWIATGYPFKIVNYETVARDLYCEPKKKDNRISCAKVVLNSFDMVVFDECFSYYSRVMLEDGSLEYIGKIVTHKLPVKVMSYNWETRQFEVKPVVNYFDNGVKPILLLSTNKGTVKVTGNHKYYRLDGTSVLAGELKVGDVIASFDNGILSNSCVLSIKMAGEENTYNIEVEGNHNYICGGSLVSNCHMLKHHSSQRTLACRQFNAKYRVGLTGTPLDGRLEEIHSIFQILKPGLFVSKQKFMERYAEYDYFGAVKGYHHIKEVSDKIAPYYLRRLKEEVLKDLPPKIHKDMMVELSPKNMKAYKDLVKKKNEITENASAMELVMRARQFLDFPEILGLHNSSDKYAVFKELLDELVKENNHKVIIFSQYTNTLHWLMKNLESEYKNILVIDGSVDPEERQEICKKFNTDQKYRILIGSNAMSTGLNLQAADDVINYTADFSPAIMKQREDRAYRCGVTHTVTVYDFVCMDTVDERVRNILTRKQTVNNALLGENVDSFEVGDMSAMEILSCL